VAVCLLVTAQAALDWWFEIPWAGRLALLLADAALLAWLYRQRLHGR
jgi:hypothetical protein